MHRSIETATAIAIIIVLCATLASLPSVVSANVLFTVSQELGNDNLGYVLLQDATVRGTLTSVTIRLDLLAVTSGSQLVIIDRCKFYDSSTLVLRGPNKAAANAATYPNLYLKVHIRNCVFTDGNTGIIFTGGNLRNAVVVIEGCTFDGASYAPSMYATGAGYLSTYSRNLGMAPRCLFVNVTLQVNSIVQFVDNTFTLSSGSSSVVAILIESLSPSSMYGLQLQATSAFVVERCQLTSVVSGVAALWFQTSGVLTGPQTLLRFRSNTIGSITAGGLASPISLGSLVDTLRQPSSTRGEVTPLVSVLQGTIIVHGNIFRFGSSSGSALAVDFDQLQCSSSSIIMVLTNTVSVVTDNVGTSASITCFTTSLFLRIPGVVNGGILSIGRNVVSDSGTVGGACTALAYGRGVYSSGSRVFIQCNTYDAVAPWNPSSLGASSSTISEYNVESTCVTNLCFVGNCASLSVSSATAPCSCACSGVTTDSVYCSNVDTTALLEPVKTITKTRSIIFTASPRLTLTKTAILSTSVRHIHTASARLTPTSSIPLNSETRNRRLSSTRNRNTRTHSMTPQQSVSFDSPTEEPSMSKSASSSMSASYSISLSKDGASPTVTGSPLTKELSASLSSSPSISSGGTNTAVSVTITAPTPSSDGTMTSTETATVTTTQTLSNRSTRTPSSCDSGTVSRSGSVEITATQSQALGGPHFINNNNRWNRNNNGTLDTLTMSSTRTVTRSRTLMSATISDDATQHMVLTYSTSNPLASGSDTATPSEEVTASASRSLTISSTRRSPSRWKTMSETTTLSGEVMSASRSLSNDDTQTIITQTESITSTTSVSLTGEPSLTETPSAVYRSNTTSASPTASSEVSLSRSTTQSSSSTVTMTRSIVSLTADDTSSRSLSASLSRELTASFSKPTASNEASLTATPTDGKSMTDSFSAEIASMSNTKKPLPSRTASPSKDTSRSTSVSQTSDVSATATLMPTPTNSASGTVTESESGSFSVSQSVTLTLSKSVPSITEDFSNSFTLTTTVTKTTSLSKPTFTDEPSLSSTSSVSPSSEISRTPSHTSSPSFEFGSATTTFTETKSFSTDASQSESNDRKASATVTATSSKTHSFSETRNREDPLFSHSASPSLSRLWLTFSNSSTPSWSAEFASSTVSGSISSTYSHSASASLSDESSASRSASSTLTWTATPSLTISVSSSSSASVSAMISVTSTMSMSSTETATATIRRSFSRQLSRSRSISEEQTLTDTLVATSTRTFYIPFNNLKATNLFAEFQSRASTCVQMMVYILFPLGILLLIHLAWSVKTWWSGRGFVHVPIDTYRDVSLFRSLIALHTYASLFYPCHVRCAVLHSLQAICHMTTWTTILLVMMDRLGTESVTLRAIIVLVTLLIAQVLKPIMNMLGFYYRLEDAEDGYTADVDGVLMGDPMGASMRSTRTNYSQLQNGKNKKRGAVKDHDVGDGEDAIDFEMNDNEWEAYRADRSQLFQERIREEDIDIDEGGNEGATENVGGQQHAAAIRTPVKTARSTDDDFEIAFEDEDGGEEGNGKEGTFSILTLTGDRIAASKDDGGQNHVKTRRDGETKKEKKLRRKSEAEATVAAKAGGKGGSAYGFGELDNFVLFHDDYASFQNRGHQLRLEQYADEHANDTLVAVTSSAAQSTPDQDHEKSTHPPTGDNAEGDEEDQRTLTSSCVSIEVDDDDDGNNGGGIFALGPLAGGGGIDGDERDDDEVSISDPRILRTLHYPYIVILLAVIAIDLWVIVGWYRNEASVCSSWIFTLWWITWLVDAVVCETLYLLSVMMFRYLIREPHEEDIHGRARRYFDGVGGKRDLRWWRGNLLHPYEGETRYR